MKKTKPRIPSVSVLKKQADRYFSLYVRYRDSTTRNGEYYAQCITCQVCRPVKEMQNGHFVSRAVNVLRYDERNCNAQCYSCNVMKHGDQYQYAKAIDLKYGNGTADELHALRFTTRKFKADDLLEIIEACKQQIREYEK
jgi:hypothetical protein